MAARASANTMGDSQFRLQRASSDGEDDDYQVHNFL